MNLLKVWLCLALVVGMYFFIYVSWRYFVDSDVSASNFRKIIFITITLTNNESLIYQKLFVFKTVRPRRAHNLFLKVGHSDQFIDRTNDVLSRGPGHAGVIYRGYDRINHRWVALKTDDAKIGALLNEIEVYEKLVRQLKYRAYAFNAVLYLKFWILFSWDLLFWSIEWWKIECDSNAVAWKNSCRITVW